MTKADCQSLPTRLVANGDYVGPFRLCFCPGFVLVGKPDFHGNVGVTVLRRPLKIGQSGTNL